MFCMIGIGDALFYMQEQKEVIDDAVDFLFLLQRAEMILRQEKNEVVYRRYVHAHAEKDSRVLAEVSLYLLVF